MAEVINKDKLKVEIIMLRLIDDIVHEVGGIINFFLCIVLATILASAFMVLFASVFMLWCKVR